MLKTFARWIKDNRGEDLPIQIIPGEWFAKRGLPIVVKCTCCEETMCIAEAVIDERNQIFCTSCVSGQQIIDIGDDCEEEEEGCPVCRGEEKRDGFHIRDGRLFAVCEDCANTITTLIPFCPFCGRRIGSGI